MYLRTSLCLTALFFHTVANAWGPEGHAIVADIAEKNLSTNAQTQVSRLLALEKHTHLDEIASWADQTRNATTAPWHFVDIPLDESHFQAERDCPNQACVVAKISQFAKQLADNSLDNPTREVALKWLVHFVGDIHQPLHAEDDNDRGGNDVKLRYFNKTSNLHRIWDSAILENALDLKLGKNFSFDHQKVSLAAEQLNNQISTQQRSLWQISDLLANIDQTSIAWAEEAHLLAPQAYQQLPADLNSNAWSDSYEQDEWPIVQQQLQKAGLRLAELLNEALI
jgi:hypothetical protein